MIGKKGYLYNGYFCEKHTYTRKSTEGEDQSSPVRIYRKVSDFVPNLAHRYNIDNTKDLTTLSLLFLKKTVTNKQIKNRKRQKAKKQAKKCY